MEPRSTMTKNQGNKSSANDMTCSRNISLSSGIKFEVGDSMFQRISSVQRNASHVSVSRFSFFLFSSFHFFFFLSFMPRTRSQALRPDPRRGPTGTPCRRIRVFENRPCDHGSTDLRVVYKRLFYARNPAGGFANFSNKIYASFASPRHHSVYTLEHEVNAKIPSANSLAREMARRLIENRRRKARLWLEETG